MTEQSLVSRIGFGCAKLFRTSRSSDRQRLINEAFDLGITRFDVARMYGLGEAEAELGKFLKGKLDQVEISTKFGIQVGSSRTIQFLTQRIGRQILRLVPSLRSKIARAATKLYTPKDFSIQSATASLKTSLRQLRLERINTFFLHEPTPLDYIPTEIFEWLENRRREGSISNFGVSGELEDSILSPQSSNYHWPVLQFAYNLCVPTELLDRVDRTRRLTTFGAISSVFKRFEDKLKTDAHFCKQCAERFERDPRNDIEIASILMRSNLEAIPNSNLLFSTSNVSRLRGLLERVQSLPWPSGTLEFLQNEMRNGARNR